MWVWRFSGSFDSAALYGSSFYLSVSLALDAQLSDGEAVAKMGHPATVSSLPPFAVRLRRMGTPAGITVEKQRGQQKEWLWQKASESAEVDRSGEEPEISVAEGYSRPWTRS